jgi:hypothetical protein
MRLLLALSLAVAAPASAQLAVNADFAVGGGLSMAGDEGAVFSASSLYAAVHWNGLSLPWLDSSTGIGVELKPATIALDGNVVSADYRVWSLNRVNCPKALYCGVDLKIGQGGDSGWAADFDQRIVVGVRLARLGAAVLNLEVYSLEDDRPVSAFLAVRWGGENQP